MDDGKPPNQNTCRKIPCGFSVIRTHITADNHGYLGTVCIDGKTASSGRGNKLLPSSPAFNNCCPSPQTVLSLAKPSRYDLSKLRFSW